MKRKFVLPLLLISILFLSACGSANRGAPSNNQSNPNQQTLPLSEKLAIGTLKLEGTPNAVTAKQASDLLPLWQVYSSLIISDTAAQQEKDALAQQIQETMSPPQIQAIDSLNLTQREIFTSMQQLGISASSEVNANGTPAPNGGGFPGGGGPFVFGGGGDGGNFAGGANRNGGGGGGGFGGNGGTQLNPNQIATLQARRSANGGSFNNTRLLTPLVQAVIKLLESKA